MSHRILNYVEDITYRVNAGVRKMGKGKALFPSEHKRISKAKESFCRMAKTGPLHLKLDMPDPSGRGGNSDTAEMARRFFWEGNKPHFLKLVTGGTEAEKHALG